MTTPTLSDDLQTIAEMMVRWHGNDALRTSRHNAPFHLEKAWYRLTDYLAEAQPTKTA